jgi:tagatose 1,6-diphosphate aldolase
MTNLSPGKLWGLRRLADNAGRFKMLAVDQRPPIKKLIAERRGADDAPYDDVCAVKAMLVEELAGHCSAVLLDPHYAYPAAAHLVSPAKGVLLTLEDSNFAEDEGGRRSTSIDAWSVEKIKRAGGDAVKVLAWYRPDASAAVREYQQEYVAGIGDACRRFDIPFVFELLVYPFLGASGHTTGYVEDPGKQAEDVLMSVAAFAGPEYGVDLFKLESPWPAADVPDPGAADVDDAAIKQVSSHFAELGRLAGRPWVMLSAGATKEQFSRVLRFAYDAGASGYLAGRAIWWDAFQQFPDWDAMRSELVRDGVPYVQSLNELTDAHARPWTTHPTFGDDGVHIAGAGPSFRTQYADFAGVVNDVSDGVVAGVSAGANVGAAVRVTGGGQP